jgi:hypothetical protein
MSNPDQAQPNGPEQHMPALAAEFVETCKAAGINLDFQLRTLPFVDKYLAGVRLETEQLAAAKDPSGAALVTKNATWIGAYLGEVIRRETGGLWYEHEGSPALDVGEQQVDPVATVLQLFEKSRADFGDVKIETTKQYCEWVCRMQRQWIDHMVLGHYDSMAALRTSMTRDAKLAGVLLAHSQLAVQNARLKWAESLNFKADSLDAIERMLGKMHNLAKFAPPGAGPTEDQISSAATLWGVYVGEVIRRHYGGQWGMGEDSILSLAVGETQIFPIAKARKRIVDGPAENIRYYFASVTKLLQG